MAKLSQCAKCDYDRRICGHYKSEDDMDCPHYACGGVLQDVESKSNMGTFISMAFGYVIFALYIYWRYFDDARVLYILFIPLLVLFIWGVVDYMKNRKRNTQFEKKKMEKKEQKVEKAVEPQMTSRTLLQVALHNLNLQYDFDDTQKFCVIYQGEKFRIFADDENRWIQIQDCGWYEASLDDIDNLALLHRAVNECNIRDGNKIVFTYNKIEKEIWLHTLCDLLWIPQIPDIEIYLQTTFNSMLQSHQFFFQMMEKLRREEYSNH